MGRIHRYGQTQDCLIFNFVATNTIEGQVLRKLLEKLQEIRNALDDDSVFNVVGEVLTTRVQLLETRSRSHLAVPSTPTHPAGCRLLSYHRGRLHQQACAD
jgi:hypothetical protein